MILISHRGNINGPNPELENTIEYIEIALSKGFEVEIDVWGIDGDLWLGHDEPLYKIDWDWLEKYDDRFWIHCKNIDALLYLSDIDYSKINYNYFWHETDKVTLTSFSWIWAYPGNQPITGSIAVLPELYDDDVSDAAGICSDYIIKYKK